MAQTSGPKDQARIKKKFRTAVEQFVAGLSLDRLYSLSKICRDTREALGLMHFHYREEPPSRTDLCTYFEDMRGAFPELEALIGFPAAEEAILGAYLGSQHTTAKQVLGDLWQTATERRRRSEYRNRLSIPWNMPSGVPELLDELNIRLWALQDHAHAKITGGEWDRLGQAESWLEHCVCAGSVFSYGDQEAVVYLRSRDRDVQEQINWIIKWWRDAEETTICERNRCGEDDKPIIDSQERRRYVRKTLDEAEDRTSLARLRMSSGSFWGGHDKEELIIEATMLRTVEWCDIGGFEMWWQIWTDDVIDQIAHGGFDSAPASACWLFALARSDLALRLLGDALQTATWALQLGKHDKDRPWRVFWLAEKQPRVREHTDIASAILFVAHRTDSANRNAELLERAADFLLRTQSPAGGWHAWTDSSNPSVESTAMAVHALALARPRGWQHAATAAAEWLWAQQDAYGCWYEEAGCGFATYQTVLVLDAIALANGGHRITFRLEEERRLASMDTGETSGRPAGDGEADQTLATRRACANTALIDTEQNILEAVGHDTLTGQEIARKAGYPLNSNLKGTLSSMRKRGILGNAAPGYFVTEEYLCLVDRGQDHGQD